ncbi:MULTISPECIES: hypothetical protein [unclassified Agromyces]|uniref:hypothetical protein n=1 Tax=unclassified Agromyces TaxID=2639701 RepID=UPI0030151D47
MTGWTAASMMIATTGDCQSRPESTVTFQRVASRRSSSTTTTPSANAIVSATAAATSSSVSVASARSNMVRGLAFRIPVVG